MTFVFTPPVIAALLGVILLVYLGSILVLMRVSYRRNSAPPPQHTLAADENAAAAESTGADESTAALPQSAQRR